MLIRVRPVSWWCDSRRLCELFNPMTPHGNYEWPFVDLAGEEHRLRLVADDPAPDFWAVSSAIEPDQHPELDPARTVVFQMEPEMWSERMRERWGPWAAPSPLSFLQVRDHRRYRNSCDPWIGRSYAELHDGPPPEKTGTIAACVSAKYADPGHVKRVDFLHFLDAEGFAIDIFGDPANGFRRGRGMTPPHDKSAAVLPYRYYFDAENHSSPNMLSEKIVDAILGEALCFYYGAPNLDSFVDPRAYIPLELDDFEADLRRVREAIANDEWSKRLPYIRAEKRRILDHLGFLPTLALAIDPARESRRWHADPGASATAERLFGETRGRGFVEISERRDGGAESSETLDAERRLRWSGLVIETHPERAELTRPVRDCTVAIDRRDEPVENALRRNGIAPNAIEWLNLAVERPSEWLGDGGRLDLAGVRANVITMPLAGDGERGAGQVRLAEFGYLPSPGPAESEATARAAVRIGREDVFGFFHLCTINNWREVLAEQALALRESGLADRTVRLIASVVGPEARAGVAALEAEISDHIDVEVIAIAEDGSAYERPVLEHARAFCECEEPLARAIYYLHAKGVSTQHFQNPNVADWRRYLQAFIVGRWRECLEALADHDLCGVNWHDSPRPHFSGNFWWASPRYVATLPLRIGPAYIDPELWIGTNQPAVRSLHASGVNHYREPYPPDLYG